ncbi:outer membrane protein transport protein [Vibrio sp. 16]|uniref:outer membrane protein transport protein n=1 Tax=Vibrio sp. 16 TaxID=391586 RepID=UPI002FF4376C
MNKKHCSLLTISILFACNAHSAGFQVAEHSASGLGRAFSGEGAVADNASVLARNPAAMTLFENTTFSGALSIVDPEVNVTQTKIGDADFKQKSSDVAPMQFVPAAYFIHPVSDKFAVGFASFTTYGVATDYPDDIYAGDLAGNTSLLSVNLNPNVAFKLNEQFSLGAGLNLVYAEAKLDRHQGGLPLGGKPSDKIISMTGETIGFGWNIGALYELEQENRFGFGYRSAVNLNFDDGEFTDHYGGVILDPNKNETKGQLQLTLPAILELSAFHQLNDQWAVHYGWQWTQWSSFKELKATSSECKDGVCFKKTEHYEDNQRWSVGTTYTLNKEWTLRAGLAYDEQAGEATLSIPDSDRFWYSAGLTYLWSDNLSLDAGFTLVQSKSGSFKETDAAGNELTFDADALAFLSAVQLNYTFK